MTTNVKPCEIEEVREQLKRKVAPRRAPHPSTVKTMRIVTAPEKARQRRRALVGWFTAIALLTCLGAVAHHRGYRPPPIDVARFGVPQVDLQPLWSTLGKAKNLLRAEQDRLFAAGAESARALGLQKSPAPTPVSAPVPIVEQLEVDEEEQLDIALSSSFGLSSNPEDVQPILCEPSALMEEGGEQALIEEGGEQGVDEQGTAPIDAPSQEGVRQPEATRGAHELRGKGVLRLNSLPWAEVYVNGELVGHTPEKHLELPAGRHEITLKNTEHNLLNTFVVRIRAGRVATRIVHLRDEEKTSAP